VNKDGGAVLKELRGDGGFRAIPVILTSAMPEQTIVEKCSGYDAFLRKPYKYEKLLEAINNVLGQESKQKGT
jgi:CheY-like chemotaxis protein